LLAGKVHFSDEMGKIRLLPDVVASQVAAGEVVERPASLVKNSSRTALMPELPRIWIDYAGGGSRLVMVRDDGCGHGSGGRAFALSGMRQQNPHRRGSFVVRSMGFRGEAFRA
jgi:DNA mismatch repair protein MutL